MDGPSRLSKKSSAFFGSLQNASLFVSFAVQKAAAVRRKRLLPQAFCRHSIQHGGTPAPSYSPCETERFFSKQRFFGKLKGPSGWTVPFFIFSSRGLTRREPSCTAGSSG